MKRILGIRRSTPDISGYPDAVKIYNGNQMELFAADRFGTNPNPTKPKTTLRWPACYAQIVAQEYDFVVITTEEKPYLHLRLSFLGAEKIPTTNMNFNHDGLFYAIDVNIEKGWSNKWRGSSACQVVHPADWDSFIGHFKIGEKGTYELVDNTNT
jgi:hypothetical protein